MGKYSGHEVSLFNVNLTSLATNPALKNANPQEYLMKRQDYLNLSHVTGFIRWLATELDSESLFQHQYVDRRSGKQWACKSLYGAFQNYSWNHPGNVRLGFNPGVSSTSNGAALSALSLDLVAAAGSDSRTLKATLDVMAWGGVTARNAEWLKSNASGLSHTVHSVQAAINTGDSESPVLRSKNLRFNSGMTKVYSLVCKDFIIYDSRVAAGLGWLVVKYCQVHGLNKVPDVLSFPWAAAKEGENVTAPKRRDPGIGSLQFKRLRSGHHHALWNMRASWILNSVLAHPSAAGSSFHSVAAPNAPLRAVEAALFMLGYDLGTQHATSAY
jgi:hypothetical protein